MNQQIQTFHNQPLDKLVQEYAALKKQLGPNHVLVQELWREIKQRQPGAVESATAN